MFNVCPECGEYRSDKIIDANKSLAICPSCNYEYEFKRLPLFIITGASGAGKSSIGLELAKKMNEVIVMESDILWSDKFIDPTNQYKEYGEMWLRLCKNISQGGKPVVLCGSCVPERFEGSNEVRYFSEIYYLALVCEDDVIRARLKARPDWRKCGSEEFIKVHIDFNNWFKENADRIATPIELIDTSYQNKEQTLEQVIAWISEKL
ncbi:MAG: AAA family ATPase [Cellulosilyticaceae bacterium]